MAGTFVREEKLAAFNLEYFNVSRMVVEVVIKPAMFQDIEIHPNVVF